MWYEAKKGGKKGTSCLVSDADDPFGEVTSGLDLGQKVVLVESELLQISLGRHVAKRTSSSSSRAQEARWQQG
jgi:hypothetical protein